MMELISRIKNAYECSTLNNNLFEKVIKSIKWNSSYYADSEYYFTFDGGIFTTPSLNPFEITKGWRPAFVTADGSYIEI